MAEGRIIKALSGFYYVQSEDGTYQCRGRGVFRNKKITPLVGDVVQFDITAPGEGYIMEIMPRENQLKRPPIANINQAIIASSATSPGFNTTLLDRFLVMIEAEEIDPVIFITKKDTIGETDKTNIRMYKQEYEKIGYHVELLTANDAANVPNLKHYFKNKITVIAGQSGVGKSSLLNSLNSSLYLKTGEISKSLGRGKHTTKHVELLQVHDGLVADTPGFSSLEFSELESGQLADCFPEMRERKHDCKFRGCRHYKEPKCAVKEAVENSEIASFRYKHYLHFLEEIQARKPRY